MSNEELVKLITKEVVTKLKTILSEVNIANQKRVLVLEKEENLCPILISALREKGYGIDCLGNMGKLNSYEGIILQSITNTELANLSHGIGGSLKEKIVVEALLSGNKIFSMKNEVEYKKFSTTSNKLFFNMFRDYENKLKSYGIHFVELNELLDCLGNKCDILETTACIAETKEINCKTNAEERKCNYIDLTNKKLISEVELRNILKSEVMKVVVSKKAILTPLAMDFARVNKIEISKL